MTELISVAKTETRHPIEGAFGNQFLSIHNHCRVMAAWVARRWKNISFSALRKICKILFEKDSSPHQSMCYVQISWNLADGKLVNRALLTAQKKQNFAWLSSSRYCADRAQNLSGPEPKNWRMYSECSRFHPNRFTYGRVILECTNTIERGV